MSGVSPSPLGEGRGEGSGDFRESETPSPTLAQGGGSERWKRFREMDAQV
jgi:hypothetical protein